MEFTVNFGSRDILNRYPELEIKIIEDICELGLDDVILLTDISDLYDLQDTDIIQANIKKVFGLDFTCEETEKLTAGSLILAITRNNEK
jgi:hypothetical protein